MSVSDSVERVPEVSHGRTDKDGLTKMNSPSDINSRNATPAGGHNESTSSPPVSPDLSVPVPQPNPSGDEGSGDHAHWFRCDGCDASGPKLAPRPHPVVPSARVDLDLDEILRLAAKCGGESPQIRGTIPALVAEVRRLCAENERLNRILFHGAGAELAAERDAARAEAERLRERTHEIADEANRRYAPYVSRCAEFDNQIAAAREHFSRHAFPEPFSGEPRTWWDMTSQYNRLALMEIIGQRDAAVAEAAQVREALQAAERKVRAVELLHVWTNEDGKRFVFMDDLAVALEIPGALDAALGSHPDESENPTKEMDHA